MESGKRELEGGRTGLNAGAVVGGPTFSCSMRHGEDADFPGGELDGVECG